MAAEREKSGVDDDETNESGTTSLPLLDRVALLLLLLLATFNGNDDAITGIGEEEGGAGGTRAVFVFVLLSPSSDGSVFVVRLDDDVAIVVGAGRVDEERAASGDNDIRSDCSCSRFKRDNGTKEPVLVLEGEFEFVVLDDTAMAGTKDNTGAVRVLIVSLLLAASPQHQSPIFHFLLLSSLVVWFILSYCMLCYYSFVSW